MGVNTGNQALNQALLSNNPLATIQGVLEGERGVGKEGKERKREIKGGRERDRGRESGRGRDSNLRYKVIIKVSNVNEC